MKILITISMLALSFIVNAGAMTAAGTVTLSGNGKDGVIFVTVNGSGNTACETTSSAAPGLRYWFKPDSDYNRALLSMLLSAQMSGKRVYLTGSGSCLEDYPYNRALSLYNMVLLND